jgi:hypothetical protein
MAKALDNMKIWDALGKTDPAHTKQFTRAGGFRGTAIKPMWANLRMTEFFGPCGIGWGQEKPEFTTVEAAGEILVYCTVCLWYLESDAMTNRVYGVGGDKVLSQIFMKDERGQKIPNPTLGGYKTYPQTDDEAFKKAYTDALSNAMKFIGVGADVHLGQFEDNKYVQSVAEEFKQVVAEVEKQKATPAAIPPELDWSYNRTSGILICRILDAKKTKKKKGEGEFITLQLNNELDKGKKPLVYYFHATHQAALLEAKGKVVKLVVEGKGDFFNVETVLEIDGIKTLEPPTDETQARLLASTMDFEEEDIRELHSRCKGSWSTVLEKLKEEKVRRESLQPA